MRAQEWSDVRAEGRLFRTPDERQIEEHRQRILAELRAYRLAEIREKYGFKQTEIAEKIGVTQSRVSRMERGELERAGISTIRDYVEALGGEVEVIAKFGDERIVIA